MTFIDGVHLLTTTTVNHSVAFIILGVVVLVLGAILAWFGLSCLFDDDIGFGLFVVLLALLLGCLSCTCFISSSDYPYNTYKVTVDDDVNLKEFTDAYTVISRDGEIWTIKPNSEE